MTSKVPSITPQLVNWLLGFFVAQAVAFGILGPGGAQTALAVGGIVIPAAFGIATALHLGRVHAAIVAAPPVAAVVPVDAASAATVVPVRKVTP